jgi:hypothetical protein
VLENGEGGNESQILVNKGDATVAESTRAKREFVLHSVDEDLSLITGVETGQDLDEGGFAATVGSEESMDLAGLDGEFDTTQGGHSGERLLQARNFEELSPSGRAVSAPTGD